MNTDAHDRTGGLQCSSVSSPDDRQATVRRISVVITNYNHGAFVQAAVDSALALEWADVEVIVVDDGSTDDSLMRLAAYGERIVLCPTANSGQRSAANEGFALSSGDVVIFLDADDVLPPELPIALAAAWGPAVSKVQFQVQPMDINGLPIAKPYPNYDPPPSPEQLTYWMRRTSAYPTPPGSGNAYARWLLEKIFPLDESIGPAADSGCLAAAAILGKVVAVPGILVGYRWHRGQLSDLLSDPHRFAREVMKARGRWRLACRTAGCDEEDIDETPLFRSRELLQFRVAAFRLDPRAQAHLPGDGLRRLLRDILLSASHPGPESLVRRLVVALWCLTLLMVPRRWLGAALRRRYRRQS